MDGDAEDERRPARRRLSSDERREEFVEKAIAFFAEEGMESSTHRLARRLGVTQPLLYRYFPSKDDLIAEVYDRVYLNRWRPEWADLIANRSRPLEERLREFYARYTEVIFNREWMQIYLFSGLKGAEINRRYVRLVRARILEPIVVEARAEAGRSPAPPVLAEIEFAWVMHGGIFCFGVRELVYESCVSTDRARVIDGAVAALVHGLRREFEQ